MVPDLFPEGRPLEGVARGDGGHPWAPAYFSTKGALQVLESCFSGEKSVSLFWFKVPLQTFFWERKRGPRDPVHGSKCQPSEAFPDKLPLQGSPVIPAPRISESGCLSLMHLNWWDAKFIPRHFPRVCIFWDPFCVFVEKWRWTEQNLWSEFPQLSQQNVWQALVLYKSHVCVDIVHRGRCWLTFPPLSLNISAGGQF